MQQYDRAIADFDSALALQSKHVSSLVSRGRAYESRGDRARAIEDYSEALRLTGRSAVEKDYQAKAAQWLAALQAAQSAPPVAAPATPATTPSRD
jgi:tetratricopeptide (TPR) repeat protein